MPTEAPVVEAPRRNVLASDSIKTLLAPPSTDEVVRVSNTPPAPVSTETETLTLNTEPGKKIETPGLKAAPVETVKKTEAKTEAKTEPVVPAVDETEEFLKGITDKSRNRFNELATTRAKKMAAEDAKILAEEIVAKRMSELPKVDPETARKLEETQKRATELESELRKLGVERSPEFQAKFVERPKAIKAELSNILANTDVAPEDFFQHLDKTNDKASRAKLNELLETIGPLDRAESFNLISEYLKIDRDRTAVITDPETAAKTLQQEHESRTKAFVEKLQTERRAAVVSTLPTLRQEAALLFEGEAGEIFGKEFDSKMTETDRLDLEQFPPQLRAQLIGSAFLTKPLLAKVAEQQERIADLQAQVDGFQKKTPGIGTGRVAPTPVEESQDSLASAESVLGFRPGSMPRNRKALR